jgi:phosphatidylserine/phosphatidylglycerophosphate/cardiolipin synthase-like enzyme
MRAARLVAYLLLGASASCAPAPSPSTMPAVATEGASSAQVSTNPAATAGADSVTLVETAPVETTLDHPSIPEAADVWPAMIDAARQSLDIAEFYVSDAPNSRLTPVLAAVERAADRGVHVRLLVEQAFYGKYPESVDRLAHHAGIEVRHFDLHATMGGILHAKYFVVDRREAYVGSQNFDYRSLEHIQEMGVRLASPSLAAQLDELFAADWDVAGGAATTRYAGAWHGPVSVHAAGGIDVKLGASPRGWLPDAGFWDMPELLRWIDAAARSVDVQVLTYKPAMRDRSPFRDLDDALRRAAGRGVRVRLLVSHWGAKDEGLAALGRDLRAPSEVRILTIPPWSGGDIPFARVAHAKFAVVDGTRAWVGTSNWEGDYFLKSRNVSVFVEGAPFAGTLQDVFDGDWGSRYAAPLPLR